MLLACMKSMQRQTVSIPKSGIRTVFEKDEMIHTENSFKYTPDSIKLMLSQATENRKHVV